MSQQNEKTVLGIETIYRGEGSLVMFEVDQFQYHDDDPFWHMKISHDYKVASSMLFRLTPHDMEKLGNMLIEASKRAKK